ncbi:hypothetical protein HY382_03165 [Candidatus Curtissbacteria bacterium]|nr:hypothetical protein [Candidatus Curtissbacteria bacterium]
MSNDKVINKILSFHHNLITVRPRTSFGKIFKTINKAKKLEYIYVEKPKVGQMAAVMATKVLGKSFFWIQKFENPPVPDLLAKLLLSQADKIIVSNRKEANRVKSFGISKSKIDLHYKKISG